jgi:hypothetical protein
MRAAVAAALEVYDRDASRYHSSVYGRQRTELVGKVHAALHPLFVSHLKNLHKLVLREFRVEVENAIKVEGYDFARVVDEARRRAQRHFEEEAGKVVLEQSGWDIVEARQTLEEDMEHVAELLRKEETRKMVAVIEVCLRRFGSSLSLQFTDFIFPFESDCRQRNIKRQMSDVVELALNTPTADMWDKVLVAFKAALAKAEEAYLKKATSQSPRRN